MSLKKLSILLHFSTVKVITQNMKLSWVSNDFKELELEEYKPIRLLSEELEHMFHLGR